jgi:UDP-N-acetylglucosamine--N-acetylmuramyl-(pentapeptide) pyrophosphoryl-undecaprenol N-acetylglucosamine transferase
MPIREFLYQGNPEKGLKFCGFTDNKKPVLLIMAGGLGSIVINESIRRLVQPLRKKFRIIHLCGKNKYDSSFEGLVDYKQFEYLQDELADVLACADLVLSRAGATSIYELLALAKPHILLPLSKKASRGDQIDNAKYFSLQGFSQVIYAEEFSDERLLAMIFDCYQHLHQLKQNLINFKPMNSVKIIKDKLTGFIAEKDNN